MRLVQLNSSARKITTLALSFPTLVEAHGLEPFDPDKLDAWACRYACSGGTWSARFILAVWSRHMGRVKPSRVAKNPDWEGDRRYPVDSPWRCGLFDVVNAMGTWDTLHRAAFVVWAKDPWWP